MQVISKFVINLHMCTKNLFHNIGIERQNADFIISNLYFRVQDFKCIGDVEGSEICVRLVAHRLPIDVPVRAHTEHMHHVVLIHKCHVSDLILINKTLILYYTEFLYN